MSIATELTALATNLENIKSAITEMGGTVSADAGFNDIASSIETIPVPVEEIDWAKVGYYSVWSDGWSTKSAYDVESVTINQTKFVAWRESMGITGTSNMMFEYSSSKWRYDDWEAGIQWSGTVAQFRDTVGITATPTSSWASIELKYGTTVDPTSPIVYAECADATEFATLSNSSANYSVTIDSNQVPNKAITSIEIGTQPTALADSFTKGDDNLSEVIIPANIITVGNNVFADHIATNEPLTISGMDNIQTYGNSFCLNSKGITFTEPFDLRGKTVGNSFLGRTNYNQPITLDSSSTVGNNFLTGCSSFNSTLTLGGLTSVGENFLQSCSSFNKAINCSSLVTIGAGFLTTCTVFNQQLDLSSATSIGGSLLKGCKAFNQQITLSNSLTAIPAEFLSGCSVYNQPLTIPNSVTTIGNNFLYNCIAFNKALSIPSSVTTIPNYFLYGCTSFNQAINLPNATAIGQDFMYGCTSYNQSLVLSSSLTTIGQYFMYNCSSFNQSFALAGTITSIGSIFFVNCDNMTSTIDVGNLDPTNIIPYAAAQLSVSKSNVPAYTTGVGIRGTTAQMWVDKFYAETSNPYRNLRVVS